MNIMNYEEVKDYIRIKLVSRNASTEGKVTRPFLDMIETFYVDLGGRAAVVNPSLAKLWQKTSDQLHEDAIINAKNDYRYQSMEEILFGTPVDNPHMMVLTNSCNVFGAGVIASTEILTEAAAMFGEDILIIPSSIHEVIVIPKSFIDVDVLTGMINQVNSQEVSEDEQLSDHAYWFSIEDKILRSAKEETYCEI